MLSLANVSPQQGATYYKTENYYSKADAVGYSKWTGSGADKNGLAGAVEHHTFSRLLAGKHPEVAVGGTKSNRRAGLDMTFSAPKSVSLQALVFADTRLVEAHRKAVDEALRFAEAHYALHREGPKEARVKALGQGLIVAQFEHDTSRLKDPQLHTHNVVLNRVVKRDGEVKALCADEIYRNSVLVGMIYQNSLAQSVKALGYGVNIGPHGTFELAGWDAGILKTFSKRKEQIQSQDPQSYRQTRELVLKNRQAKDGPQLREDLVGGWQTEANAAGVKSLRISKTPKPEMTLPLEKVMEDALAHASLRSAVFRREDVIRGALEIGLGRFPLGAIEKSFEESVGTKILKTKTDDVFTSRTAVERDFEMRRMVDEDRATYQPLATRAQADAKLSRLDALDHIVAKQALSRSEAHLGALAAETPRFLVERKKFTRAFESGHRLSLADITQARAALLEDVKALPKSRHKEARESALQVLAPLERAFLAPTRGQKKAVEATLMSTDRVIIWQGVAGAGKTFSMRQIIEEAARTGVEVRGLAPSAAAAVQLTSEAGIEATTLQSHLLRRETRSEAPKLWIVDEAGMVAAADMHKLLSKAQDSNARVLLVGDTAQLSPIDAGNPFADLQQNTRTTVVRLDESLRQKDPELQKAVAHMNAGDMVKAMETLQSSIHEYKAASARSAAAARAFLERPDAAHESTLLLARTNETRADITQRVREGLKQSGVLKNPTLAETFERIDVPESKQHYASSYAEGALLVPNRSYRSLGLEKDTPYEIEKVDAARNTLSVRRGDAKVVIDLSVRNNFSMFAKATIEIAEGDRMIWNRNVKAKGQINNRSFVIDKIVSDGIHIRTDSNETRLLTSKERQHMEHAWALTIYKAQGRTSSAVIQVADAATDARALLVGITRASNNALVMGPAKDTLMRAATREEHKSVAAEVVLEANFQTLPDSLPEGTQRVQERRRSRGRCL